MINRVQAYRIQPSFNAKVNFDTRCSRYYNQCPEFKRIIDIIELHVKSSVVDVRSASKKDWSGARLVMASSLSAKGGYNELPLGEIGENTEYYPKMVFIKNLFFMGETDNNIGKFLNDMLYLKKGDK